MTENKTIDAPINADEAMDNVIDNATRFVQSLNAALADVLALGYVGHESAQNIARMLPKRMGPGNNVASLFGEWLEAQAMGGVDFKTCMIVNAVVRNPPKVTAKPKLSEAEKWMARLAVLNLAYAKVLEDMASAGMDDTAIGEIENTINDPDETGYEFPEHLKDRIDAVKDSAYVGTVDRGRKVKVED
jgi:hypothetical protein